MLQENIKDEWGSVVRWLLGKWHLIWAFRGNRMSESSEEKIEKLGHGKHVYLITFIFKNEHETNDEILEEC